MGRSRLSDYDRSYRLQISSIICVSVINFLSINILSLYCLNEKTDFCKKKRWTFQTNHAPVRFLKPVLCVTYSEKSNLEHRLMLYMTKMSKNIITLAVKAETRWWYQFSRETCFRHLDRCYFHVSSNIYGIYISCRITKVFDLYAVIRVWSLLLLWRYNQLYYTTRRYLWYRIGSHCVVFK
jgi:hypothetical protein